MSRVLVSVSRVPLLAVVRVCLGVATGIVVKPDFTSAERHVSHVVEPGARHNSVSEVLTLKLMRRSHTQNTER